MANDYIINPGSVWQTYNTATGQTTYGNAPAGYAAGANQSVAAPAVATPANTPAGASVYQGASLGYAPMGQNTMFREVPGIGITSNYAQNPAAYPNVKPAEIPSQLSIAKAEKAVTTLPEAKMESVTNQGVLKNKAIAEANPAVKANPNYINALYKEAYNRDATANELARFANSTVKDAANIILGQSKSPFATRQVQDSSGAIISVDEAQVPNVIESPVFMTALDQVVADIRKVTEEIAAKESELAAYQANTDLGVQDIGEQLGRSAALIGGEQGALQQRRQTKELALIKQGQALETKLARLQQDKQFIVQQANQLSQNAQQNLSLMLSSLKGSSTTWSEIPLAQRTAFEQLASQAGVPAGLLSSAIDAMANTVKLENQQKANDYQYIPGTENQPGGIFDKTTGKFTPTTSVSGAGIVTSGAGNSYDIASYATDPNHEASVQSILNRIGKFNTAQDIDNYIKSVAPSSPITGKMIANASEKYGVDWETITAIMQQDSNLGTVGAGARSFNPGNVGNTETATSTGRLVNFGNWQAGVDAVAKNLAWRKTTTTKDNTPENYAKLINEGKTKIENVPEKMRNAVVAALVNTPSSTDTKQDIIAKEKAAQAIALKNNSGLSNAVGTLAIGRWAPFQWGQKSDFIAGVEQLVSGLSLEQLIEAKGRGATFGALSDSELRMLASAATKIGTWRQVDKNGNVTGYKTSEKSFKDELDNISRILTRGISNNAQIKSNTDPLGILNQTSNSTNPLGL